MIPTGVIGVTIMAIKAVTIVITITDNNSNIKGV
jgi:hypothetical protein